MKLQCLITCMWFWYNSPMRKAKWRLCTKTTEWYCRFKPQPWSLAVIQWNLSGTDTLNVTKDWSFKTDGLYRQVQFAWIPVVERHFLLWENDLLRQGGLSRECRSRFHCTTNTYFGRTFYHWIGAAISSGRCTRAIPFSSVWGRQKTNSQQAGIGSRKSQWGWWNIKAKHRWSIHTVLLEFSVWWDGVVLN